MQKLTKEKIVLLKANALITAPLILNIIDTIFLFLLYLYAKLQDNNSY